MSNTSNGKFWASCCYLKFFIDESVALCFMGSGGYHGVSASPSSRLRILPSNLNFSFCDLHIFKLSIFTSSVFTPILHFFTLKTRLDGRFRDRWSWLLTRPKSGVDGFADGGIQLWSSWLKGLTRHWWLNPLWCQPRTSTCTVRPPVRMKPYRTFWSTELLSPGEEQRLPLAHLCR